MTGTIARMFNDKGYGFIKRDDGQKDLFFHAKELKGVTFEELREGDALTFEVGHNDKGDHATNIRSAKGGASNDESMDMAA